MLLASVTVCVFGFGLGTLSCSSCFTLLSLLCFSLRISNISCRLVLRCGPSLLDPF